MAETNVPITPGTGANIDTFQIPNGNYRQSMVIADPTSNAGAAPVDATNGLAIHGGVASAVSDSGNPVKIGGRYNSNLITLVSGMRADIQLDQNAYLKVTQATLIAGEDLTNNVLKTERRSSYSQITASTLIKSGAGRLRGIFVSSASSTPTIKIWDNTSAASTILIDTFTPLSATYYNFGDDANFATGLYVTIGGTVSCTVFSN